MLPVVLSEPTLLLVGEMSKTQGAGGVGVGGGVGPGAGLGGGVGSGSGVGAGAGVEGVSGSAAAC